MFGSINPTYSSGGNIKILLIQPSSRYTIKENNPKVVEEVRGTNPPLGIMYLASYLMMYTNHTVDIYDGQLGDHLAMDLQLGNYDVVGISVLTFTLLSAISEIDIIRKFSPKSKIIVGGTHPTIYPKEMLQWADIVVRGEGETIFPTVLKNLDSPQKIFASRELEQDLDSFPYPYRTHIDKYNSMFTRGRMTILLTSRGCPFNCAFCFRPVVGRNLRVRSVQNVVNEIDGCVDRGINSFLIYDDTFTVDKNRVMEICQEIIKRKLKIKFDVRTRVDMLTKDMLVNMKRAGAVRIKLGIESGVQRVLNRMRKGITLQQIKQAFLWCKQVGIETFGYIMLGNPGETYDDIEETIRFTKKISPDYVHCAVFTPYPSTESYQEYIQKTGKDPWLDFARSPSQDFQVPVWGDITREELEKRVLRFYKEFYLRPKYILQHLWCNPINYIGAGIALLKERNVDK